MSIGKVYRVFTNLTKPSPKEKIILRVSDTECLYIWFNSKPQLDINENIKIGQIPVVANAHEALSHDSYLDASRLIYHEQSEVVREYSIISSHLATHIVSYLSETPPKTLTPQQIKMIVTNLSTLI